MKQKTLADLLTHEAHLLNIESPRGFVYSSYPYPCGMTEATMHARRHAHPTSQQLTVTRKPCMTRIQIKPRKGTGKRKPLIIRLWVTP